MTTVERECTATEPHEGECPCYEAGKRAAMSPVGDIAQLLAVMRAEVVAEIRNELAAEVRTRRVVVVEADGFERVLIEGHDEWGDVIVQTRADEEHCNTMVRLAAADDCGDHGDTAYLSLMGGGNTQATFETESQDSLVVDGVRSPHLLDQYRTELHLHQPNDRAGLVVDCDGLRQHKMRLYYEEKAHEQWLRGIQAKIDERGGPVAGHLA